MTMTALDAISAKKPKRVDALRNYEALIDAARAAFAEHGTDTALEDVARRAGVGIATLYRNFPTRGDLIEAVYVDEIMRLAAAGERLGDEDPWTAFVHWVEQFVEYIGTKHVLIDGLNKESETFKNCRSVLYASGEPVLQRAQDAGLARADITIPDVIRLIAGVAGVAYDDDAQRNRIFDLAVDGLRSRA